MNNKKLKAYTTTEEAAPLQQQDLGQKMFDDLVKNKLRSTEDQLRDAASRLEARIGEQELVISLMENRIALSLDPRHEEKHHALKLAMQQLNDTLSQHGI